MEIWAETKEEEARYWNGSKATHWLVHQEYLEAATPQVDRQSRMRTMTSTRTEGSESRAPASAQTEPFLRQPTVAH
jgi:hypothetical protein